MSLFISLQGWGQGRSGSIARQHEGATAVEGEPELVRKKRAASLRVTPAMMKRLWICVSIAVSKNPVASANFDLRQGKLCFRLPRKGGPSREDPGHFCRWEQRNGGDWRRFTRRTSARALTAAARVLKGSGPVVNVSTHLLMSDHPQPDWNPKSVEVLHDPRAAYDDMRRRCPMAYREFLGWPLFRHADVLRVF